MQQFSGNYYVHDNELYRKVTPSKGRYKIKNKNGKYEYLTMKKIQELIQLIAKRTTK